MLAYSTDKIHEIPDHFGMRAASPDRLTAYVTESDTHAPGDGLPMYSHL